MTDDAINNQILIDFIYYLFYMIDDYSSIEHEKMNEFIDDFSHHKYEHDHKKLLQSLFKLKSMLLN